MARLPWLPRVSVLRTVEINATLNYAFLFRYSFAYATMGQRLPTILGKAIEDVVLTLNQEYDEERMVDLVHCIERMDALKQELQDQAKLRPIIDDGEADVALWNKLIAKYFQGELLGSMDACNYRPVFSMTTRYGSLIILTVYYPPNWVWSYLIWTFQLPFVSAVPSPSGTSLIM